MFLNESLTVVGGVCRSQGDGEEVYKWVAVVEKFFDIIYGVHVELEGRAGRHAGQKRTYKAVSNTCTCELAP